MDEAQALCDRVAIMDSARIIAEDAPQGLIESLPFSNTIEAFLPNGHFKRLIEELPGAERVTTLEDTLVVGCSRLEETLVALIGLAFL